MKQKVLSGVITLSMSATMKNWMVFVDGENLAIRASDVLGDDIDDGDLHWVEDEIFWKKRCDPRCPTTYREGMTRRENRKFYELGNSPIELPKNAAAVRAHYYVVCGSGHGVDEQRKDTLKGIGFHPFVYPEKGTENFDRVDVRLATDLVGNAYRDNYDAAVLIGGDGDYVPAVKEAQRRGKTIFLGAFDCEEGGINAELRRECDYFLDLRRNLLPD